MYKLSYILEVITFAIKTTLEVIISLLLTCLIGPIFLTFWFLNEITRIIISCILHLKFGKKYSLVPSGADNMWHYKKPGNNRMCVIAMFSDDPIIPGSDLDEQRTKFLERVIQKQLQTGIRPYEKLTKTFTKKFGYDCFREDEFDIRHHVKMYQSENQKFLESGMPEDAQFCYTEQEFLDNILPQLAQDMDDSKPQWEQVIIPRVKCSDREAIQSVRCFRYHHGYMDGATANLMFSHCLFDSPPENFPHVINPLEPLRFPKAKIFLIKAICILTASFTMVKTLYKAARLKGRFVTKKYTGRRHFGWSDKLDAGLLRRVKLSMKVSAPTILCTATGGALRKMNETFATTGATDKDSLRDKHVVLGLINALLPYKDITPRNQFTLTHFTLPIGDMTWTARMSKVDKEVRGIPFDPAFFLNNFMFRAFGRFPSIVIQALMEDAGNPISFSNVPMTNQEVSLFGTNVNHVAGWPPLITNTGLGIIIMRYANHVRFLGIADEACISREEMKYFMSSVTSEIREMSLDIDTTHSNNEMDVDSVVVRL